MAQTLAVKYRPRQFDEVCGQRAIRVILEEQIKTKTHKNAYLFCGPAGCGKTTLARIFADGINSGKGNPIEIDAASNNGVEDVRNIIQEAGFKALDAEYKVYILDECHMFSNGAWNAMLKLIEEPPAKTIFIFCTTDPQKIPSTILSRVQRYDFSRLPYEVVLKRLQYILGTELEDRLIAQGADDVALDQAENSGYYDVEEGALEYIAKLADGGMRDAITMLDKVLSYEPKPTVKGVVDALSAVDYSVQIKLFEAIVDAKSDEAISTIEEVYYDGRDLKTFMRQFQLFVLDVYKYKIFGDGKYLQTPEQFLKNIESFNDVEDKFIAHVLKKVNELNTALKWDNQPKMLIECEVLQLCLD